MARPLRCVGDIINRPSIQMLLVATRGLSRISNELVKGSSSADLLMTNLKNSLSTKDLLDQVGAHCEIMNTKHVMQTFRSLFAFHKTEKGSFNAKDILKHPSFEKLCVQIKKGAGTLEVNEAVEALKVLTYMGVKSSSTIMQVLLQLVRHNINNLNLPQIIFLDFLLHQLQITPLVEALKIALPIVFETQMPVKMSRDDMSHIAEYLHYISKRQVSEECIESVVAAGIKCKSDFNVDTARSIIWSICDMQPDPFFEPLLNKAIHVMTIDMENMRFDDVETTISKLLSRYSNRNKFYYNETLFDISGDMVVYRDLGFEQGVYILKKFAQIGHCHPNLLEYVCSQVMDDPSIVLQRHGRYMHSLVFALSVMDYKPTKWDELKPYIEQSKCFENYDRKDLMWVKLAASLASLDIYKEDVIQKAFDINILQKGMKKFFINDYDSLFLVRQAILLYKPNLMHLLPSESTLLDLVERIKESGEEPLHASLVKGLGGEQYIESNVKTNDGLVIDNCVVIRNGCPVNISKYLEGIKNNQMPEDSQVMAVLAFKDWHYQINNPIAMRGSTKLFVKILEDKGFSVVPLSLHTWNELEDYEKIPYIMQAINERIETKNKVSNQT